MAWEFEEGSGNLGTCCQSQEETGWGTETFGKLRRERRTEGLGITQTTAPPTREPGTQSHDCPLLTLLVQQVPTSRRSHLCTPAALTMSRFPASPRVLPTGLSQRITAGLLRDRPCTRATRDPEGQATPDPQRRWSKLSWDAQDFSRRCPSHLPRRRP